MKSPEYNLAKNEVQKSSLEANVKMPQTHLAIALYTIEKTLNHSHDPHTILDTLIKSVPQGQELTERTKKANAQHVLYNIDRVLTEKNIEELAASSMQSCLDLFVKVLPNQKNYSTENFSSKLPKWSVDEDYELLNHVYGKLREYSDYDFLYKLFKHSRDFLSNEKVSSILKKRKDIYYNWSQMTEEEKDTTEQSNTEYTEQVRKLLSNDLEEFIKSENCDQQQEDTVDRFIIALDAVVNNSSGR